MKCFFIKILAIPVFLLTEMNAQVNVEKYRQIQDELGFSGSVELNGAGLSEASDAAELDTCASCWYREPGSPWVWLALDSPAAGQHSFALR